MVKRGLVKADDLMSATQKAPDAEKIRDDFTKLQELEEREVPAAKVRRVRRVRIRLGFSGCGPRGQLTSSTSTAYPSPHLGLHLTTPTPHTPSVVGLHEQ
jgi:hypothetical protein